MNDEWMYGRNKRGCEGIFPVSYVDIRKPLPLETDSGTASRSASVSPAIESHRVLVLYNFNAQTEEDLTIKVKICVFHSRAEIPLSDKRDLCQMAVSSQKFEVGGKRLLRK